MTMKIEFYKKASAAEWKGRTDPTHGLMYQHVQFLDLETMASEPLSGIGLIGFCSDEGVRRNQGRVGAKDGPKAFRGALSGCAFSNELPKLYDCGDIVCESQDLEGAQLALGKAVHLIREKGLMPMVIGGGHETAWGHYLGLESDPLVEDLAIVNFDAHFDMRQDKEATSGTAFMQIAQSCQRHNISFHYYCFGIQPQANTEALFMAAKNQQVHFRTAEDIFATPHLISQDLKHIIQRHQAIYLTICLDVFAYPYAPGVSAVSDFGLTPWQVIPALKEIAKSGKLVSLDIVELAPNHDKDNITAKLASTLSHHLMSHLGGRDA